MPLRPVCQIRGSESTMQPDAREDPPSPEWSQTLRIIIGILVVVLLAIAAYAFRVVFIPLIIGAILAYVLTPLVRVLSRATRLPHGAATALVFIALLALVVPLGIWAVQELIEQSVSLGNTLIGYIRHLDTISADTIEIMGFQFAVGDLTREVTNTLIDLIRTSVSNTVGIALNVARIVVFTVFTAVIAFYLTRDSSRVLATFRGLVPPNYRDDANRLLAEIDGVWSSFLRGQVILSLTVMVILTVMSALLGLPQPLLLGIWGGLLELLPSIGNMIWGATVIIIAIVEGSTYLPLPPLVFVLIVIAAYVAFSQLDINVLIPNIIGGQVRLHPMVVLLGVIIGLTVGGVLGVALAAPTIASLRVIGRYVYAKLFGLEPFPMVGPPAAPAEEREKVAQQIAAQTPRPIRLKVKRRRDSQQPKPESPAGQGR